MLDPATAIRRLAEATRHRRACSAFAALTCMVSLSTCTDAPEALPPSIILISLDTCRADHMSLYGYGRETTPYLTRFAEECLVFDRAHTVAPWTLTSHVTMLTGLYPEQHGVVDRDLALSHRVPFLAQRLKNIGYRTLAFFKPGFIGERYGHDRGFDLFEEHRRANEAEDNLNRAAKLEPGSPFFLFLHLFDIHSDPVRTPGQLMYRPPAPYDTLFHPGAAEVLAGLDFRGSQLDSLRLTESQREALVSLYDGKIRYIDHVLESWIEGWRARGLLENTVVIITSDHGDALGQRGRLRGHGKVWQEALNIPMLVRFPDGYRAGERERATVSLVDVVPTVLEAVGEPAEPRLPGYSLRGEMPSDRVVGASRSNLFARVQWPWKIQGVNGQTMGVYNLEEDPGEQHPIRSGAFARRVEAQLNGAFDAELEAHPGFDAEPLVAGQEAEATKDDLRALGYAVGGD